MAPKQLTPEEYQRARVSVLLRMHAGYGQRAQAAAMAKAIHGATFSLTDEDEERPSASASASAADSAADSASASASGTAQVSRAAALARAVDAASASASAEGITAADAEGLDPGLVAEIKAEVLMEEESSGDEDVSTGAPVRTCLHRCSRWG